MTEIERLHAVENAKARATEERRGELEMYEGKLTRVVDASRQGYWRFHQHYDRDGYCDNPARGY